MDHPLVDKEGHPLEKSTDPVKVVLAQPAVQHQQPSIIDELPSDVEVQQLPKWTEEDVVNYFSTHGYPEYADVWHKHKIDGERLVLLSADDIKELGIDKLGDRLGIQKEIEELMLARRKAARTEVVYRRRQAWNGSCLDRSFATCCGIFPWDPARYTLTRSALRIESFDISRICGIWKCLCMGGEQRVDNISLDMIRDVDTTVTKKGLCCCEESKVELKIAVGAGGEADNDQSRSVIKTMYVDVEEGEGKGEDDFANLIYQQIEEYRQSFRQKKMGR